jgi:hypothetical protein
VEKRFRAFAAWISSFMACCCCVPGVFNPNPVVVIPQQGPINEPQNVRIDGGEEMKKPAKVERISRANFERIQDGMTMQEVMDILGNGTEQVTKSKAAIRQLIWRRQGDGQDVRIIVTFAQGRVTNKNIIGD